MRMILLFVSLFLISQDFVLAQCGYRPPQPQAQTRQKSSLLITDENKDTDIEELAAISKKEAKKVATSNYPGKVKEAELIKEEDTLVWKLEVKGKEGQKEVFIDPASGEFLGYGLTK